MSIPTVREAIARAIYEEPKADGTTDDWNALPEDARTAWLKDADRVLAAVPSIKDATLGLPAQQSRSPAKWECPINYEGCTRNCGNYGCGN